MGIQTLQHVRMTFSALKGEKKGLLLHQFVSFNRDASYRKLTVFMVRQYLGLLCAILNYKRLIKTLQAADQKITGGS